MNTEMNSTTKTCSGCKETKPVSSFSKNRTMADGLQHRCKLCANESNRRYCGQNRNAQLERHRQYRKKNRNAVREYQRHYYAQNKAAALERIRRYNAANPQANGTTYALARSPLTERELFCGLSRSQVNAEVRFDYVLRDLLTQKTGITHHVDHIKPLCEGGVHRIWNLAVVTEEQNLAKGPMWFCEDNLTDNDIDAQDEAILAFVPAE